RPVLDPYSLDRRLSIQKDQGIYKQWPNATTAYRCLPTQTLIKLKPYAVRQHYDVRIAEFNRSGKAVHLRIPPARSARPSQSSRVSTSSSSISKIRFEFGVICAPICRSP